MPFGPIFATLRRQRTAAALIVLEFALTFAIVCNAVFLVRERVSRMQRPSGIAEAELLRIEVSNIGYDGAVRGPRRAQGGFHVLAPVRSLPAAQWRQRRPGPDGWRPQRHQIPG
jgi:putative ABC transport system permease protein